MLLTEFLSQRVSYTTQYFPCPQNNLAANQTPTPIRTIMLTSHIWWTELLALAILNAGYNLLLYEPLYFYHTDAAARARFDYHWSTALQKVREHKVDLLLGGNTTAILPHATTGELFHSAANIPVVHYWWDEPRAKPPFAANIPTLTPDDYLAILRDDRTLNVIWDIDVLEELQLFFNIHNSVHVPLATDPDFWPNLNIPLDKRPLAACFLGNCHFDAGFTATHPDPLIAWANSVIDRKQLNLDAPMIECLAAAGPAPQKSALYDPAATTDWSHRFRPWEILNAAWMHRSRNVMVQKAFDHLNGKLALIGKGWDKLQSPDGTSAGLRANSEHAGHDSGRIYAASKASLNLFGGCVHAGMPLRPFDITASGGLLLTHYQRELPALFEPNHECLAFRSADEMLAHLDRVLAHPEEFESMRQHGAARTRKDHTWLHRIQKILQAVHERLL